MSTSTTYVHRVFVGEPIDGKPVTALAGIGLVLGRRLTEQGFWMAEDVLVQFLEMNKNELLFKYWLKYTAGANAKQQDDCYKCLKEWCDNFM